MTETPEGWYPDPQGGRDTRWWDGQQWTDQTRTVHQAQKAELAEFRSRSATGPALLPTEAAREAWDRGDLYFQLELEVNKVGGFTTFSSFGSSANRVKSAGGRTDLLGQLDTMGWELQHVGYVFVETGATTSNRITGTGQGVVTRGKTVGIYLFRRREA